MKAQIVLLLVVSAVAVTMANNSVYLRLCPRLGVYNVPNTRSCSKYYTCFNGQVIQQQCADGLQYDAEIGACNLAHLTKCKLEFCNNVSPIGVAMVANPDDCSRYYACSGGVSTHMRCPAGLLFNREIASCDLADKVTCTIESESFEPVNMHRIACPPAGVKRIGNPLDCGQYTICIEGKRIDYYCTGELRYDTKTQRCEVADKARCAK